MGSIVMCDFTGGFKEPEMVKRRPVVVLSPKIMARPHLCTVVALSSLEPDPIMPYHRQIDLDPELPAPWNNRGVWVKGDMVNAVGFHRLDLIRLGKDRLGKREYLYASQSDANLLVIRQCVLRALGLSVLTKHL
jgi:mRNA interferase MazF